MVILLAGDPREGFEAIGPFVDFDAAEAFCEKWDDTNWWPLMVSDPNEGREAEEVTDNG